LLGARASTIFYVREQEWKPRIRYGWPDRSPSMAFASIWRDSKLERGLIVTFVPDMPSPAANASAFPA
jgi:hypothetical protein